MQVDQVRSKPRRLSMWEENLFGVANRGIPSLVPGIIVASILAWLSTWSSDFIGVSVLHFARTPFSSVSMAIVLGLVVGNIVSLPAVLQPGLNFSLKKLLRLGIILLGIRLSILDVLRLGAIGIPIVMVCIIGALVITTQLNRRLNLPERLGMLIAVGTSICGVSAIAATGPAIKAKDEEVAYAVAVITIFGIFATLVYPYVASFLFGGSAIMAGLFLGTSIHDTSQVTGAALVFSELYHLPRALDVATVTKLTRNVFIAFLIPLMALWAERRSGLQEGTPGQKTNMLKLLPMFVLGFVAMAVLRSLGDLGVISTGTAFGLWSSAAWQGICGLVQDWAVNFLTVALAAVGLTTSFRIIKGLGLKPFLVGLGAALAVGAVSFVAITLLGGLVSFS